MDAHGTRHPRAAALVVRLGLIGLLLAPAGCGAVRRRPPVEVSPAARERCLLARNLYRKEDLDGAIANAQAAIVESPRYVPAHRIYQDASLALGRVEAVVAEYEARVERAPDDPVWRYLYGRLQITPSARKREFRKAIRSDRECAWAWNGLAAVAHQERKTDDAERYCKRAISFSGGGLVEPMIGLARICQEEGRYDEAHKILRSAAEKDPTDPLPHLIAALVHRDQRQRPQAMAECERAFAIQPTCRAALRIYRELLPEQAAASELAAGILALQNGLRQLPNDPDLLGALGHVEMVVGKTDDALSHFEAARAKGLCPTYYADAMRLLYVRRGAYDRALAVWREKVPEWLTGAPGNVVADRFRLLTDATATAAQSPQDTDSLLHLAEAYAQAGWVKESLALSERIAEAHPALQAAFELRSRVRRHTEFCDEIEQLFRSDYVRFETTRRHRSLRNAVSEVERLAAQKAGLKIEQRTRLVEYPFMGQITDYAYPPRSDLMKYLDRFNQTLVMGKPSGSAPVECVLMTVISRQPNRKTTLWGVVVPNDRLLVDGFKVAGYRETLEHQRIGGQTLDGFYYTNVDVAWEWCTDDIREFKRLRPEAGPIPAKGLPPLLVDRMCGEPTRLLECAWREEAGADRATYFRKALDLVDWHEMGHVADARTHLPLSRHFLSDLALFLRSGFSITRVLAYTERNAELAALGHAESARMAMGSLSRFLEAGFDGSPHAIGYRQILERMVVEIHQAPADFPEIDATTRILEQLHKLPPDKIRLLARRIAEDFGIPSRLREMDR